MYCKNCGKEISDDAYVCPNCGVKVSGATTGERKMNVLAIVGFVLAFLVPIAGLICSIIARRQIRETEEGGAGLALAGLIISIVEMCIVVLYIIIAVAVAGNILTTMLAAIGI